MTLQPRSLRALLRLGRIALCALLASAAPFAVAQTHYPNRPIKLVVPYPPGALTDLLARAIGERLAAALKQPVVIDNKPGAGTLVGAEFVAKAAARRLHAADGDEHHARHQPALYQPSPIDPVKDFAPVSQVGSVNFFLIANPAFPGEERARDDRRRSSANPGKYNYASVGSGSPHHLFMEALKTRVRARRSSTCRTRARRRR